MSNWSAFGGEGNLAVHALGSITPHGNESHQSLQPSLPDESHARSCLSIAPPFLSQARSASQHLPGKELADFCWVAGCKSGHMLTQPPARLLEGFPRESWEPVTPHSTTMRSSSLTGAQGRTQWPFRVPCVLFWFFGPSHPLFAEFGRKCIAVSPKCQHQGD